MEHQGLKEVARARFERATYCLGDRFGPLPYQPTPVTLNDPSSGSDLARIWHALPGDHLIRRVFRTSLLPANMPADVAECCSALLIRRQR